MWNTTIHWRFYQVFHIDFPRHKRKAPPHADVKSPSWRLSSDRSDLTYCTTVFLHYFRYSWTAMHQCEHLCGNLLKIWFSHYHESFYTLWRVSQWMVPAIHGEQVVGKLHNTYTKAPFKEGECVIHGEYCGGKHRLHTHPSWNHAQVEELYKFAKMVCVLSSVTAFTELIYNPISLSLWTVDT